MKRAHLIVVDDDGDQIQEFLPIQVTDEHYEKAREFGVENNITIDEAITYFTLIGIRDGDIDPNELKGDDRPDGKPTEPSA